MSTKQEPLQKMSKKYHIRIDHSLGFFSFYDIIANDYHTAEREAEKIFIEQFCGGTLETTFRGVTEKHSVKAYTFNKYNETF